MPEQAVRQGDQFYSVWYELRWASPMSDAYDLADHLLCCGRHDFGDRSFYRRAISTDAVKASDSLTEVNVAQLKVISEIVSIRHPVMPI